MALVLITPGLLWVPRWVWVVDTFTGRRREGFDISRKGIFGCICHLPLPCLVLAIMCLNVGACTLDPMVGADRSQSQPPASALCCSRRVFVSSGALGSKWTCRALIHGCQVGRVSVPHWGCRMQRGACSWVLLSENHVSDNHELAQYEASPKAASAAQQEYLRSRGYHWLPTAP